MLPESGRRDVISNATIEDLAKKAGIDAEGLKATFYCVPLSPTLHHTMGGLKINTEAQVLREDGSVIAGLYASGEVTGGIHGSNRVGGNALTDGVVFGRIAGKNAAAGK